MTSPDARQLAEEALADYTTVNARRELTDLRHAREVALARALLSALDALEQAGGGSKSDSGMTAAQSSVVDGLDQIRAELSDTAARLSPDARDCLRDAQNMIGMAQDLIETEEDKS